MRFIFQIDIRANSILRVLIITIFKKGKSFIFQDLTIIESFKLVLRKMFYYFTDF